MEKRYIQQYTIIDIQQYIYNINFNIQYTISIKILPEHDLLRLIFNHKRIIENK